MSEAAAAGRRKRSAVSEDSGSEFEMSERPLRVTLLPGEKVKGRVAAWRCNSPHATTASTAGILLCTNFRVAYIPPGDGDHQDRETAAGPLGENEVALTCIERLVAVSSSRSKVVTASSSLKFQPEEVVLHCRDLRLMHLQLQPGPHSRQLITTIAQSCRLDSPRDLFVFDFAQEMAGNSALRQPVGEFEEDFARTQMFDTHLDWERELARTGAQGWRVSLVNERFEVSDSLSKFLVVPRKILDLDLKTLSAVFTAGRIPRWHWHHAGSNLLRMGSFLTGCAQRDGLSKLEELVSGSQGWLVIADLSEDLPSPADIQQAYTRLRGLCTRELPGVPRIADEKWLSTLEATRWLDYVRLCLKKATEVSALLWNQRLTVTLQESDDRDLCCVVSSLVQLLLDPACRTLHGFQSLVQKEWVSAGHRFSDRLNYTHSTPREESPVFLLFLDCVWQLWDHYPFTFEFTDTYLLAVHSATQTLLSGTFLFNCPREQVRTQQSPCSEPGPAAWVQPEGWSPGGGDLAPEERVVLTWGYFSGEETPLPLPSAWDWSLLLSSQQQHHHRNTLYSPPPPTQPPARRTTADACQWRRVHVLSRGGLVSPGHALPWRAQASVSRRLAKWSRSLESLLEPEPGAPREPGLPSLCPSALPLPSLPLPAPSLGLWKGCYLRWDPVPGQGRGPWKRQWSGQGPGQELGQEQNQGPSQWPSPGQRQGSGQWTVQDQNQGPRQELGQKQNQGPSQWQSPGQRQGSGQWLGPGQEQGPGQSQGHGQWQGPGQELGQGQNQGPVQWQSPGQRQGSGQWTVQEQNQGPGQWLGPGQERGPCQAAALPSSRARLGALWSEVRRLGRRLPGDPPANGPRRHGDRETAGLPER